MNPDLTTVNDNNSIPLNTLPFHNCNEPTICEYDSSNCYKAHDDSK